MENESSAAVELARALAARDADRLLELMHPEIEFRALTPRRGWEADDAEGTVEVMLGSWFKETDHIDALERLDSDAFADRQRVGYRFRITNPEGRFLVEQQAYIEERDGQIGWLRVLCSGYRPLAASE